MALDEAMAESVRGVGPFLRFYTWEPGTLSLGRFQNPETGLSPVCRGVPRVRRLTGGGGIWHENELTYSLGCTQDDVGVTGVKPSFERLCGFLLDTWTALGWDARFAKDGAVSGPLGTFTPACFAGQEEYDILVNGKKLGGNAQRRDRTSIFQHGSIPLVLDRDRLDQLFLPGYRPEVGNTTDLASCGWTGTARDLIGPLAESFRRRLGGEWEEGTPTAEETRRAETLVTERYGTDSWTDLGSGSLRDA